MPPSTRATPPLGARDAGGGGEARDLLIPLRNLGRLWGRGWSHETSRSTEAHDERADRRCAAPGHRRSLRRDRDGERRERLKEKIETLFEDSHQTYGYRRIHAALLRSGEQADDELVRNLMRELGLRPSQSRPWRPVTTSPDGSFQGIPDLVRRDFTAERPGIKLVGGITYIPTWEGFVYLATVIDCHSKMVVGWAMADHYKTALICDAIDVAAGNIALEEGCVFHSDRGSNYTSGEFGRHLARYGMRRSVGRTGVCWDNALAESFFGALKNERLNGMVFTSRAKARREVVKYIEGFYNRRRLHSANGYRTPLEVHHEYLSRQLAS
ncbi:IS3 family transposase [Spongiactinospora sp. 9N601]|uniref:IS3 family transposase n=1 Tax=Spongiactinospora sp. 9N601 TaxID=3375149 RepID=UPI00379128CF